MTQLSTAWFQDDAHFSYLSQEPGRVARFARSVVRLALHFGLDGVNVEWLRLASSVCGSPRDARGLALLLRHLRALVGANRLQRFQLAFTLHLQSSWKKVPLRKGTTLTLCPKRRCEDAMQHRMGM